MESLLVVDARVMCIFRLDPAIPELKRSKQYEVAFDDCQQTKNMIFMYMLLLWLLLEYNFTLSQFYL